MSRTYTLYGSQGSGSAAVEIALGRTGAPWRMVRASSWEPDSAQAKLAKLNPLKQIPVLVLPDGSVLTESAAILIHLGLTFPSSRLLPAMAAKRAQSIRGLVFIVSNCYSAIGVNDHPDRWIMRASKADRERVRRAARRQLHRNWDIFADQFPGRPFLSGAYPGGLDFLAVVVSKWAGTRKHLPRSRPQFYETLRRIERHPSAAAVLARHWPS